MIVVIKRDGEREEFSTEKIALSIMGAASKFGGEDYELADQISEDILDRLEESNITEIAAEELQSVVEKELIEQGHAATAKEYILTSANRERVREMNSHLMKTLEDLTFSDAAEVKKENANIDSDTAMGTMLKYGSEAAKRFNVTYMMSKDVAEAHQNGDIHIHDLDFFSLTETCVTDDTLLDISENGEHKEVRADYFDKFLEDKPCDSIVYLAGFKVKSGDEYVKLKNCVKHSSADKKVLKISSQLGEICVTSDHRVCIQRGDEIKDVRASEVVTGDKLLAYTDKGMTPSYVCSVKEIKYTGFVYDFETANHYFNANGFKVHNCCQIPLDKLFKDGFNTGHGFLREPGNIRTAGALAAIAIQSNQNDQHGGQSVPMFDYYLAPYVALTFAKEVASIAKFKLDLTEPVYKELKNKLVDCQKEHKLIMGDNCKAEIEGILNEFFKSNDIECSDSRVHKIIEDAYAETDNETFQAMEAFIHNLNTMHCLPASEKIWVYDVVSQDFKTMTMEELNNSFKPNRYKVVSLNKETGKAEFKFITHCKKMDNNRKLIKLTDSQGRTVRVTDNHRIMTMDGIKITEDIPENCNCTVSPRGIQLPAAKYDLCVSDYGKPIADDTFQSDHILINESFAEFIGYYMADGYIMDDASTCCITTCGKVAFEEIEELLQNAFGCKFKTSYIYFDGENGTTEKAIHIELDKPLAKMIADKFGSEPSTKKVPVELMFAPKDVIKSFLRAYFKLGGKEASAANKCLREQLTFMLSSVCISAQYKNCDDKENIISLSGNDSRVAEITDGSVDDIKYSLRALYEKYPKQCAEVTGHRNNKNLRYSELCKLIDDYGIEELSPLENIFINDIESKDELNSGDEYVYDISVEDNESFLTAECIFVHNSRAGAQVPFSSVNYGTDTSVEGRMVIKALLRATEDGLGNGETPIFPIQIMKLKKGVNIDKGDPNYDIFELACAVSAKRLYPNFSNLDAPYNADIYVDGKPETEVAYMGCRTRVATNAYDPSKAVIPGRGNLSFTSINLPRIAIEANHDVDKFFELLTQRMKLVHKELLERFDVQCNKHPLNFPFLMGQGVWIDSDTLGPTDDIREVLKNGTLSVGFIGLAEALTALIGEHHGQSEKAQQLGLKIIGFMRNCTDRWSKEEHMNYSIIGTPAEGLSGRFVKLDREKYGVIPGVTDKEYYTNSSHVPVSFPISAVKKIDIEAPYHALENGGHILYIEMDGDPTKNLKAFMDIVKYMYKKNAGYFAINHPVDRDPVCGYVGIINDVCPRCGRREGQPMSMKMWERIKGYANVGNADTLGVTGNPEEEVDRLPNSLG